MVRVTRRLAWMAVLACSACTAAQQQVAGREVVPAQPGEEASYKDPWGTPVTWTSVPASSSAPGATAGTDADENKPKAEEEVAPPQPEPETTVTTTNLSGDEDDDD